MSTMDPLNSPLHRLYLTAQRQNPGVLFFGDATRREIALTFDDGPHPRDTPRVLDVLMKHEVCSTFHLVGKHAEQHPDLIEQVHRCGHQLALHCYRHVPFPMEDLSTLRTQLERTRQVIANACGVSPAAIRDLRPPYGVFNASTFSRLTEWGYRLVMWNCMPPHWIQSVSWSIRQTMDAITPGALIVLHDGHGHGKRVAEIVDAVVPQVKSLGYKFVTVEEMQNQRKQSAASV